MRFGVTIAPENLNFYFAPLSIVTPYATEKLTPASLTPCLKVEVRWFIFPAQRGSTHAEVAGHSGAPAPFYVSTMIVKNYRDHNWGI